MSLKDHSILLAFFRNKREDNGRFPADGPPSPPAKFTRSPSFFPPPPMAANWRKNPTSFPMSSFSFFFIVRPDRSLRRSSFFPIPLRLRSSFSVTLPELKVLTSEQKIRGRASQRFPPRRAKKRGGCFSFLLPRRSERKAEHYW